MHERSLDAQGNQICEHEITRDKSKEVEEEEESREKLMPPEGRHLRFNHTARVKVQCWVKLVSD